MKWGSISSIGLVFPLFQTFVMSYTSRSESLVVNGFQCCEISQVLRYLQFNDLNLHINANVFTANSWLPWHGELVHLERVLNTVTANLTKSSNLCVGDESLVLLQHQSNKKGAPRDLSVFEFDCGNEVFERCAFDSGGCDDWLQKGEGEVFTGVSYNQILLIANDSDAPEKRDEEHEKKNDAAAAATCAVRNNRKPYQIELSFTLPLKVSQLSVGHDHAVMLASRARLGGTGPKQVFTWGCNTRGELGYGLANKSVKSETFQPVELLDGVNVLNVSEVSSLQC